MSAKQLEQVRDADLARRIKLAMGGVPTLRLVLASEATEAPRRPARTREAILADLGAVYGEVRP